MAGDWIKFEATTPDKPEVWAIAEQLQLDPDAVVGKLLRVWTWADAQTEDGRIPVTEKSRAQRDICHASVTHRIIDRHVGVPGFAAAMESVGWLNPDGSIPGFDRHNGETAKKRALARERKARQRSEGVTQESRKQRDKSVTREEKRRELKKDPPPEDPKKGEPEDPNYRLKKTKRPPEDFELTAAMRRWAAEHCPGIDAAYHTQKFLDHTFGTARQDWTATWRNWLRTEQERKHEADQRSLARPGRGETVDEKLRRLRGAGKPSVGEPDGGVRGQVLEGVWERAER